MKLRVFFALLMFIAFVSCDEKIEVEKVEEIEMVKLKILDQAMYTKTLNTIGKIIQKY